MPELLRIFGLRFFFFSNDHEPAHVHVKNADGEARFIISPTECISNKGMKSQDIHLAESIIIENADLFLNRWNEFFKKQS